MKLTQKRFEALVKDNNREIETLTVKLNERKRMLEVYGFEEENETVEKYQTLVNIALEVKKDIENGVYYF